jgi:hypothetical protein
MCVNVFRSSQREDQILYIKTFSIQLVGLLQAERYRKTSCIYFKPSTSIARADSCLALAPPPIPIPSSHRDAVLPVRAKYHHRTANTISQRKFPCFDSATHYHYHHHSPPPRIYSVWTNCLASGLVLRTRLVQSEAQSGAQSRSRQTVVVVVSGLVLEVAAGRRGSRTRMLLGCGR